MTRLVVEHILVCFVLVSSMEKRKLFRWKAPETTYILYPQHVEWGSFQYIRIRMHMQNLITFYQLTKSQMIAKFVIFADVQEQI